MKWKRFISILGLCLFTICFIGSLFSFHPESSAAWGWFAAVVMQIGIIERDNEINQLKGKNNVERPND